MFFFFNCWDTHRFSQIFRGESRYLACLSFSSKIFLANATKDGTVDTEMRRFLRILSDTATFHIDNNNNTQRPERKAKGEWEVEQGRKENRV